MKQIHFKVMVRSVKAWRLNSYSLIPLSNTKKAMAAGCRAILLYM